MSHAPLASPLPKKLDTAAGELILRRYEERDLGPHSAYNFESPREFLEEIGFDTARLPERAEWEKSLLERVRASRDQLPTIIVGEMKGVAIGMVFLDRRSKIETTPKLHFHIFDRELRGRGVGRVFFAGAVTSLSSLHGIDRFLIEPKATNAPMNALMIKLGYRFVKSYRLEEEIPMTQKMVVNQYEILV